MSIRSKLILSFIGMALLAGFIGFFGVAAINRIETRFLGLIDHNLLLIQDLEQLRATGARRSAATSGLIVLYGFGADEDAIAAEYAQFREEAGVLLLSTNWYDQYDLDFQPEERAQLDAVASSAQSLTTASNAVLLTLAGDLEGTFDIAELIDLKEEMEVAEVAFNEAVDQVLVTEHAIFEEVDAQVDKDIITSRNIIFGAAAIGFVLALLSGVGMSLTILRPIARLNNASSRMAGGDLKTRVPITLNDEVGALGRSFNDMADQLEKSFVQLDQRATEAQLARERAEKSDAVKSAFLASMSHELRTPLNAIINFTKFVAKGDLGPVNEEQQEALDESIDSAKHLLNLINDVLDMSKIEAGSLKLFIENNIDLKTIIASVVSTGKTLASEKPIEVQAEIADNLPTIRGDRQRIFQILLNVMSNACKFTDKGRIKVRAYRADDNVVISVEDTGPGVDPQDQPAVFEAFKQTTTGLRHGAGTGLGMPISKNLAEAHGGRLWVESEPGSGSTFYVSLPIASETLVPSLTSARHMPTTGGTK